MHRQAIFLTVLIPLLFITITIADNSHTFAQVQRAPTVQEVHPLLDSVEAAHDHYHERRYAEAIKAYEALLEKGIANPDGTYTPLRQQSKRLDSPYVRSKLRQNR